MISAPPSNLIEELGTLAAGICGAEAWVIFSLQAGRLVPEAESDSLDPDFPRELLQAWVWELWAEGEHAKDLLGPPPPMLQRGRWHARSIAAIPAWNAPGELGGALCLLNPRYGRIANPERGDLHLLAQRIARALASHAHFGNSRADGAHRDSDEPSERTQDLDALLEGIRQEDPEHWEAEADACEHYERMERFEGALLGLVKAGHDDLSTTLRVITEVAANALNVARAEIWLFDQARECLRMREAFPPTPAPPSRALCAADCPRFFEGLESKIVMAVRNAGDDPRGQELIACLREGDRNALADAGAMLIVPIWLKGQTVGVLLHFHAGKPREWSRDEQDFSGAVVGLIALALEADAHRNTEAQLHALAAHLDEVREQERSALARELHDELGQMLTALRMDAAWLGKACATQPEKLLERGPERVKAMKGLVDEAVATVQRISSDLRPGPLHELGLVAALEWQMSEFEKRSGIKATCVAPEGEVALSDRAAITLYRALQEALTNVARHAAATEVKATLRVSPQRVSLEIRDNGKGMPEGAINDAKSLGLIGMRERASALGGEILFRSAPEHGTAVLVSLPRPAEPQSQADTAA